jgi:peptidoglycan/xylan/chitin deacetylase (PgdA/CDA1 family)
MTVVSLAELAHRVQLGLNLSKTVAITFDDGYCDFLEQAMPILGNYDLPATIFISVALLGGVSAWSQLMPDAPIMTAGQLERVLRQGFAVGSHTLTHCRLPTLSDSDLLEELDGSRRWLQERLGVTWMSLAYPFGDFGRRERLAAQAAGYDCAVGFGGLWGNGPETNPFALNRDAMTRSTDDRAFQLLLSGWRDWIMTAQMLSKGWQETGCTE